MLNDILKLASKGLRIHPLHERAKTPIISRWPELATSDPEQIARWAKVQGACNWGVATGKSSGVFVVDIDPKNGGDETWKKLTATEKPFKTWTVTTGSGGKHYYFKYPAKGIVRNRPIAAGIDTRGENGQVVAPPSIHPNGTPYRWDDGLSPYDIDVATCPKWLMALVIASNETNDYTPMGDTLERGTRNDAMFHNALGMARQGSVREFVISALKTWCISQGHEDISDEEIATTVDSAFKRVETEANKRANLTKSIGKTDDDNANRLIAEHGDKIIFVSGIGWHVWDGKHWRFDQDDARVTMLAVDVMRGIYDEAMELIKTTTDQQQLKELTSRASWATASLNNGKLAAMVELASKKERVRRTPDQLDPKHTKFLLNLKNGTLDMITGKLKPHDPADMFTRVVPHNYNPDATCPIWERTLELAFNGNQELIRFMQRALGYTLSGSVASQVLFICWGEAGNNGKSTLLEGFSRILGLGYSQMADMKVITSPEMDNRVSSSLARMRGARMVNLNEAEDRQRLNESLVKAITGGDSVEACMKFREPFQYDPTAKLWIRTNERPIIRSLGESMWRRVILVPFNNPIPEKLRRSRDLVDAEIDAEAEGILAWAVRGFVEWKATGLNPPAEVVEAIKEYRSEQDVIGQFFDECVVMEEGATIARSQLYQAFTNWLKQNGFRLNITAEFFGRRITKKYNQPLERKKIGGEFVWQNMTLSNAAVVNLTI